MYQNDAMSTDEKVSEKVVQNVDLRTFADRKVLNKRLKIKLLTISSFSNVGKMLIKIIIILLFSIFK